MKKIQTNQDRHFSIDALIRRAEAREDRKIVPSGTLLNWTRHYKSKYSYPSNLSPYYWIKDGEDYYIAVDRVETARIKRELNEWR